MNVDVALVAWPNHIKRFQYFQLALLSLKAFLTAGKHNLRYLCSVETAKADDSPSWETPLRRLCSEHDVAIVHRTAKPSLGGNMNHALDRCESDLILLVQEDCILLRPLDLEPDIDLMIEHPEIEMIRFEWATDPNRTVLGPTIEYAWRCLLPVRRIYSDRPHLQRRTHRDKWGRYTEGGPHGSSESEMDRVMREGKALVLIPDKPYFQHIGSLSALPDDSRSWKEKR